MKKAKLIMLLFIKRLFAWWDGATLGTLLTVSWRGEKIGCDEFGNCYYQERRPSFEGKPRRWVIYKGYADASRVPVAWHGWLHHTFDAPPAAAATAPALGKAIPAQFDRNHLCLAPARVAGPHRQTRPGRW